ncbi:PE family protein PE3 [Mycobacterium attenuatum]|uniref:PE family protein n=1 Tax=Mycobacterium attenuatum TaxID=2341086 RepID=UPI000F01C15E|nr:PE-PPE domain-containing protein [Mycobacterium attenuatum]VBA51069.1 PE family protein PE3 [Mycobacterium attenuatum]
MSNVVAVPEMLATAATDVAATASAISAANAASVDLISSVLPAAGDEVSTAIAKLLGAYGQEYQVVAAQAAVFHDQFAQALAGASGVYAQAEAANATLLSGPSNALEAITAPIRTLLGQTPVGGDGGSAGTPTSMAQVASADPLYALIMGGTGIPDPGPVYVSRVNAAYIQPSYPGAIPQPVYTPEQFWPWGKLTFGQSVAEGVTLLNNAINTTLSDPANSAVVFGYSQSSTVATNEISALMALGSPDQDRLSFILTANPNNPNGGILARLPGFYIPILDVPFNGATPPNTPYPTTIYTAQYDGIANAPQYPLNVVSDLNAFMGLFYIHGQYPDFTSTQVANAVPLPTSPGYTGNTEYYMILTQNLPLLQPIRDIPFIGPPIADIFQPNLRVLVDMGYSSYGPGLSYANVPTPAGLFSVPNPFTVIPYLALGTVQGPQAALVDIGLLPQSYTPNAYPYLPSINPGVNFFLGQPTVTVLSVLGGAIGDVLELIPPA